MVLGNYSIFNIICERDFNKIREASFCVLDREYPRRCRMVGDNDKCSPRLLNCSDDGQICKYRVLGRIWRLYEGTASLSRNTGSVWCLVLRVWERAVCIQWLAYVILLCFVSFLDLVIRRTILILSQNESKRGLTSPQHEKKGASWCLPSKHSVCMPFCLFFFTLSKKLSGLQVSVQKTIETVSPNLYN